MSITTDLSKLSTQEFEELCDGCGKCCEIGASRAACPGLDTETNQCTVYKDRLKTYVCTKLTPQNVKTLHKRRVLPDSCAYVLYYRGQEPLERPVTSAALIPYAGMPKRFKQWYERCNRQFQAGRRFTHPFPPKAKTVGLSRPCSAGQTSSLSTAVRQLIAQSVLEDYRLGRRLRAKMPVLRGTPVRGDSGLRESRPPKGLP